MKRLGLRYALCAAAALLLGAPCPAQQGPLPSPTTLTSPLLDGGPEAASHDGNLLLQWRVPDALEKATESDVPKWTFEVEERFADTTTTIDAGPHASTALSGRDDGRYRYRVRTVAADGTPGPWSEAIELRVSHHPLWLALLLFGIGAAVFVATATLILAGHRRGRRAAAA